MSDGTDYTPSIDENLLNITDRSLLNLYEASGVAKCEITIQELMKMRTLISASSWKSIERLLGSCIVGRVNGAPLTFRLESSPPHPSQVPALMYQYADDVNYRLKRVGTKDEVAELLAYLHHRFVWIHPFNNGNGRTARLLLNAAAMLKGFEPIQLYHREGEARAKYIEALRKGDEGDTSTLTALILRELTPL